MANILVPTDFTPGSVKWAEQAIKKTGESNACIILFHAFSLPSNMFEMLGSSFKDPFSEMANEPFRQACKQLKDDFPRQVNKIFTRCMNGNTRALFRNFAEANDVDLIFCPQDYYFSQVHERSVNPLILFRNCGIPMVKDRVVKKDPVFINQEVNTIGWLQPSAT